MPDIDLDAIEARAKVASAGRLNWQGIDALRSLVESDVPALVALVRAKQSWIDGAKVDMAAMEEERAKALAAIALAGEEIERASVEVKRADRQRDDARAAIAAVRALCDHADSGLHAGLTMVSVAAVRGAILAALDVRHDPSATTDGGAS